MCVREDVRNDDLSQVLDKVRLEGRLSILILTQVKEQLLHGIGETLVLGILVELISHELQFINEVIGMVTVSLSEQELSLIVELVPFSVGLVLQNVTLFSKTSASVFVEMSEPALEFRVSISITVELVE